MTFEKKPISDLDYTIDWSKWLETDTISTSSWTVQSGITSHDGAIDSRHKKTTIWLTGGIQGSFYSVVNRIVTVSGRTEEKEFTLGIL